MAQHKDLTGTNLHEPKDMAAAAAGLVYISDGAGSGDFTKFKPDNVKYINAMSDFPTPSGGIITLEDNICYAIGTPLSTADRFVAGANNRITCNGTEGPLLAYTGTGSMFSGTDVNFQVDQAHLDCPNGMLLEFSAAGGTGIIRFDNTKLDNAAQLGEFTDIQGLVFSRCALLNMDQGIELLGTAQVAIFSCEKLRTLTTSATFKCFEFNSIACSTLEIDDVIFDGPAGAIALSGAAASANVVANKLAVVSSCEFDPDMTALSGIVNSDIRWEFENNSGVVDSFKAADTFITATQTVTITTQSVFVVIDGAGWTSDVASRFTTDAAGKLTYISEVDASFLVSGVATIEKTAGGTDVLEMRVSKNGTPLAKSSSFTETATPATVSSQALVDLTLGDTIELAVANNSSTGNIDVQVANLTARASG
jgi:hypothetical protein